MISIDERPELWTPTKSITVPIIGRPAGWYADPEQTHDLRYHDGTGWSRHVTHFGPSPCTGCA